jgi:holo-[acyl-carrier protein] synthase
VSQLVGSHVVGVGIDAVDVHRFRRSLARTPALHDRLFTDAELAYARQRRDPTERLAARFAAKEAVMKALGVGLGAFAVRDVEVVRATSGQPGLLLHAAAAALADRHGVVAWHLSMSHTETTAVAVALAMGAGLRS